MRPEAAQDSIFYRKKSLAGLNGDKSMYRDLVCSSLERVNPQFLKKLQKEEELDEFLDLFNGFAADAHFEIERQIINQYTSSPVYEHDQSDPFRLNKVVRDIDRSVQEAIPQILEQALCPGSELLEGDYHDRAEAEHRMERVIGRLELKDN